MAKRGGIIQAFGNLFRWTIYGLAALLGVGAYYYWFAEPENPPLPWNSSVAVLPEDYIVEGAREQVLAEEAAAEAERAAAEEAARAAEEAAAEAERQAAEAAAEAQRLAEEAAAEAERLAAEAEAEAQKVAEEAAAKAEVLAVEAEEAVEDAVDAATDAANEAVSEVAGAVASLIEVPGADTSISLVNAFRRDNGGIEVTTEGDDGATLWLVNCAPLAIGTIASGESAGALGERTEDPEMTEIPLSDPRALIAATACGVMR